MATNKDGLQIFYWFTITYNQVRKPTSTSQYKELFLGNSRGPHTFPMVGSWYISKCGFRSEGVFMIPAQVGENQRVTFFLEIGSEVIS
jgi:hypothetical protein